MKAIDIKIGTKMWLSTRDEIQEVSVIGIKSDGEDNLWIKVQGRIWCSEGYNIPYDAVSFTTDNGALVFMDRIQAATHTLKHLKETASYWEKKFEDAKLLLETKQ